MYKYPNEDQYIGEEKPTICPKCKKESLVDDGDCGQGCCDDFKCIECGYRFRMEWPD